MEYEFKEILDIGLEIEFSNIRRETSNFMSNLMKHLSNFRHVHDASSETPEITLGNIPIQFKIGNETNKLLSIMGNRSFEVLGGEINSPILGGNEFKTNIYKLIDFLIDMGESFSTTEQDSRGSIHVHVNVSKDVKHEHLVRLLELGLATESIFYRLGGMGRVNRGVLNDFIYQRPLTLPPCVKAGDYIYPIFDYIDLLKSKNKTDFYNKYGDTIYHIRGGNHYVTQRYMGLNFYSIPYRGSIEFRYANKVLIPEWICAWISLCQNFTNFALTKPKDESFENVYRKLEDNKDISEEELTFIFNKLELSEDTQITLLDIWHSSEMPNFDGEQILTHLNNPTFFGRELGYLPKAIITPVKKINVADVRVINSEKNQILNTTKKDLWNEADYVIDTTGVKTKLKDLDFLLYNDMNNRRMNDPIVHNYIVAGFNILNYNERDATIWAQQRISREKFVPFSILLAGHGYEFHTRFPNIDILFNFDRELNGVSVTLHNTEYDRYSNPMFFETSFSQSYNSKGINFRDIIIDAHQEPENYFGEDFVGNNPDEEDLEEFFDDEEDDEENIEEMHGEPVPQRLGVNNPQQAVANWVNIANNAVNVAANMGEQANNAANNVRELHNMFDDIRIARVGNNRNRNRNNEERR